MTEYKITTSVGDLFVTASSRKHAAIVARQDPRFDGVQIKKIGLHKRRENQSVTSNQRANRDVDNFMGKANGR
jgi:hypothetical protein